MENSKEFNDLVEESKNTFPGNAYVSAQKELTELRSKLRVIHSKAEDGRISTRADFVREIESVITETIWNH